MEILEENLVFNSLKLSGKLSEGISQITSQSYITFAVIKHCVTCGVLSLVKVISCLMCSNKNQIYQVGDIVYLHRATNNNTALCIDSLCVVIEWYTCIVLSRGKNW